jgi:hypothetical protein
MTDGSAYGKRSSVSANVRRCPPRASLLDSAFAAYRQCTLFFAGVAVRVAVQASAVKQRLMLSGKVVLIQKNGEGQLLQRHVASLRPRCCESWLIPLRAGESY